MIRFAFSCATIVSAVLVFSSGAVIPQALAQGVTQSIAITGGAVPAGNGDFSNFGDPALNGAGQVAFLGILKNTSGGSGYSSGIYLSDEYEQIKVAWKGDTLAGKAIGGDSRGGGHEGWPTL